MNLKEIAIVDNISTKQELCEQYLLEITATKDENLLKEFVDYRTVSSEDVSLIISKQLFMSMSKILPSLPFHQSIAQHIINTLSPRIMNFDEQLAIIRQNLSISLANDEEWEKAAEILQPLSSVHRHLPSIERLEVCLRLAQLYLEYEDGGMAETMVNKAGNLLSEVRAQTPPPPQLADLDVRFDSTFARILDYKRKFLEAGRKYYELSITSAIHDEETQLEALQLASVCVILGKTSPVRARLLATLFKDERCKSLSTFALLQSMYHERLLSPSDITAFEGMLKVHQRATLSDGVTTIWDRAVVEHNMLAASKLYNTISFEELGRLVNINPEKAEELSAKMITEGRLSGTIDQVDAFVTFATDSAVSSYVQWDDRIASACFRVNTVAEAIVRKYPKVFCFKS